MEYLCPSCGEYLSWNLTFHCWWCPACHWFTRAKAALESCADTTNHKGETCMHKLIICQEGYCADCAIHLEERARKHDTR